MGGKKKKSLADKLARMTDEERAKYFQRRADAEEEVRRRREQLIGTFMKNKLRREDAFARLNLAKINQRWHSILRKLKCKEMRENVEHMKQWLERIYNLKNRTIDNLLDELEEAEEQYRNNFQAHVIHIEEIISRHTKHLQEIHLQYEKDRDELIRVMVNERCAYQQMANKESDYLKMVTYGQQQEASKRFKENRERYTDKLAEIIADSQIQYDMMEDKLNARVTSISRQIVDLLQSYVKRVDEKRAHYQELLKFDRESAVEIACDQERIRRTEEIIKKLQDEYAGMEEGRGQIINNLQHKLDELNKRHSFTRKKLFSDMKRDEKQLIILNEYSDNAIRQLEATVHKGKRILALAQVCRKFETQKEKILRWPQVSGSEKNRLLPDSKEEKRLYEGSDIETRPLKSETDLLFEGVFPFERNPLELFDRVEFKNKLRQGGTFALRDTDHKSVEEISSKENEIKERKHPKSVPAIATNLIGVTGKSVFRATTSFPTFSSDPFGSPESSTDISITSTKTQVKLKTRVKKTLTKPKSVPCMKLSESAPFSRKPFKRFTTVEKRKSSSSSASDSKASKSSLALEQKETEIYFKPKVASEKLSDSTSINNDNDSLTEILKYVEPLEDMENFWWAYNRVKIDCEELKIENKLLIEENARLKTRIKAVLEASELGQRAVFSTSSECSSDSGRGSSASVICM